MRRVYFLLLMLNVFLVKGQDIVTRFSSDGGVAVDTSYIEPFAQGLDLDYYQNLDPSILKDEMKVTTPSGSVYTVKALRFKGWENESGDFNVVEIYKGGNKIYDMTCIEGFGFFPTKFTDESKPRCCYPINIGDETVALVFHGIYIMSQPPQITIVVLNDQLAKLVFNKSFRIKDLKKNNEDVKFVLQENTIQLKDGKPDREPIFKTLSISKDCISIK